MPAPDCTCDHGWVDVGDAVRPCDRCRPVEYNRWLNPPPAADQEPLPFRPDWNQIRKDLE